MCADPVFKPFGGNGFGISVTRCAHRRDEQLSGMHFPGVRVDDVDLVASKIHEDLFPAHMCLTHAWAHTPFPGVEVIAKPGVAKPVRILRAIFLPEQSTCHVPLAQLPVDQRPVRNGALGRRQRLQVREKQQLQTVVIKPLR